LSDAAEALEDAVANDRGLLPASRATLAKDLDRQGQFLCLNQDCVSGILKIRSAQSIFLNMTDLDPAAGCSYRLADLLQRSGTMAEALEANYQAWDAYSRTPPNDQFAGKIRQQRGEILLAQRRAAAAITEFQIALSLYNQATPKPEALIGDVQADLAVAQFTQRPSAATVEALQEQIQNLERHGWPRDKGFAAAARIVGVGALATEHPEIALNYLETAWRVRSALMAGGEITIGQGLEFADLLSQLKGVNYPGINEVIDRLHSMLVDSPAVSPALRNKINDRWGEIQHERNRTAAALP
jgi:tetratricopeptide (TPR) repeat protein